MTGVTGAARAAAGREVVHAAGALVWRVRQGRLQVLLVHRPRYRDWSWPKGKVDPGEHVVAAAVREVAEETAYDVVLGVPLPGLAYDLDDGRRKQVSYWAAQVAGRREATALRARPPVPPPVATEIDRTRWLDVEAAATTLSRAADREPLAALVRLHAKGRLETHAVAVVRHARARKRAAWEGQEADRPLTDAGTRQARALVPLLSAFGVAEVTGSGWARCVSTVAPYAAAAGVPVATVPALTEEGHTRTPDEAAAAVRRLLAVGTDLVLCTHRPVLPTVTAVLREHARRSVADDLPAADPYLAPGELLVVHVARRPRGPRLVAVERHRP